MFADVSHPKFSPNHHLRITKNENPNNNPVHSHANRKTSGKYAEPLFIIILGFVTTVPTIPWQFLDTLMPIIFSGSQYKRAGSGLGEGKEGV